MKKRKGIKLQFRYNIKALSPNNMYVLDIVYYNSMPESEIKDQILKVWKLSTFTAKDIKILEAEREDRTIHKWPFKYPLAMTHFTYEFNGGHGNLGIIQFGRIDKCDLCNIENTEGIEIDASEGEYHAGKVCNDCIKLHL